MSAATRWLVVVVASTAAAVGAATIASGSALSTVPLLWFLAVCPGMPYARMLGAGPAADVTQRWITAVGLSVALAAVVAEALLYAGEFSGRRTVAVLGVIACLGSVLERIRAGRRAAALDAAALTTAD
jgi:hypothetical protein